MVGARVCAKEADDWDRAKLAATLLLTLPGMPVVNCGEGSGMQREKAKGDPYWDEYRREPLDWYAAEEVQGQASWFRPEDRYNAPGDGISVEDQDGAAGSLLNQYGALAALRQAHPALRTGAYGPVEVRGAEGVYAFTRHAPPAGDAPEEWFLVILNFGGEPRSPALALDPAHGGSSKP